MEPKSDQLDLLEGIARRNSALERVGANSGDFMPDAFTAFPHFFKVGILVTGEDIRTEFTHLGLQPHHPNAWGSLIRSLCLKGHLIPTGQYTKMKRKTSHARMNPVYRVAHPSTNQEG